MSIPFWADQASTKGLGLTLQDGHDFSTASGERMLYYPVLVQAGTFEEVSTDNPTARKEIEDLLCYSPTQ